jgi:hypothetical protein
MGERRNGASRWFVDQIQYAHPVHEDDRAAEPAPNREQPEADQIEDERP